MTGHRFSRRTMLGTAGAVLALPILEAQLNGHGTAFADEVPLPTFFGVFSWGNGVRPEFWIPAAAGTGDTWSLSRNLQPLAAVKDYLCVISGTSILSVRDQHPEGASHIYTGTDYSPPPPEAGRFPEATPQGPSIDQIVAQAVGGGLPYRSLELAIYPEVEKNEGIISQCISHSGPNSPNFPSYEPAEVFDRLFRNLPPDPGGGVVVDPRQKYRSSVLDVVAGDISRLQTRVGAADRARLQQHFDSVRDLEHTLAGLGGPATVPASCTTPERPVATTDFEAKNQAMARVLAMALACGQTRVFTYQLAGTRDFHSWDAAGVPGNYHSLTHETGAAAFEAIGKVNTYQQERFADLLSVLAQTSYGAGTLLDQCAILATSEVATGADHKGADWPIVIAGRGGNAIKTNQHLRAIGKHTLQVHLTLLKLMGVSVDSFGVGDNLRVTEMLGGMLV